MAFDGDVLEGGYDSDVFIWTLDAVGQRGALIGYGDGEQQVPERIAIDGDEIIITGTHSGRTDFNGGSIVSEDTIGNTDPFIVRLDERGDFKWGAALGDQNPNCNYNLSEASPPICTQAVAVAGDRVFHGGAFTAGLAVGDVALEGFYDAFLIGFARNGEAGRPDAVWAKSFGDAAGQIVHDIDVLDGGPVITGFFTGEVDFGGGPLVNADAAPDVFVAGFDAAGNHRFSLAIAMDTADPATRPQIAVTRQGKLVLAGSFRGTLALGGETLSANGADAYLLFLDGPALAGP
jgi:hypothetical protein